VVNIRFKWRSGEVVRWCAGALSHLGNYIILYNIVRENNRVNLF
jgi:hypothetical protein